MLDRTTVVRNIAQQGDALALLCALPHACTSLAFLDPQHRAVLDKLKFGNEGTRQRGRAALPAMTEKYIDAVCVELVRVLTPSGYLMRWIDTYCLCEGHHLRIADLKPVDLIAWDNLRPGMGKRSRRRGDYLVVLQKPPIRAGSTWRDHAIPSRWSEKVDRSIHPHVKPIGLIARLIVATTEPGELVVDPAAGSFVVMHAAHQLGRNFIGCDLMGCEMKILGIDPGVHGALALVELFNDNTTMPQLITVFDVPVIGTGAKERVNTMLVRDSLVRHNPDHALIERAGSMPKQGVASTFKFARAVGSLETVVACLDIPYSIIEPSTWKRHHHLVGADKEASRQRALQLFPGAHTLFSRKMDHQRAEAVLIALTPMPGGLPKAVLVEHVEPVT